MTFHCHAVGGLGTPAAQLSTLSTMHESPLELVSSAAATGVDQQGAPGDGSRYTYRPPSNNSRHHFTISPNAQPARSSKVYAYRQNDIGLPEIG